MSNNRLAVIETLRFARSTVAGIRYCPQCGTDVILNDGGLTGTTVCGNNHTYSPRDVIKFRVDSYGNLQLDTGAPVPLPPATPPMPVPVERWTDDDERKFDMMVQRRNRVLNARRDALAVVVQRMLASISDTAPALDNYRAELVDAIADYAEPLIDALKPYDSGTRAASN